jgi:hypothetical protein
MLKQVVHAGTTQLLRVKDMESIQRLLRDAVKAAEVI